MTAAANWSRTKRFRLIVVLTTCTFQSCTELSLAHLRNGVTEQKSVPLGNQQPLQALNTSPEASNGEIAKSQPTKTGNETYTEEFFSRISCAGSRRHAFEASYKARTNLLKQDFFFTNAELSAANINVTWKELRKTLFQSLLTLQTTGVNQNKQPGPTQTQPKGIAPEVTAVTSCIALGKYFAARDYAESFIRIYGAKFCSAVNPSRWAAFGYGLECQFGTLPQAFRQLAKIQIYCSDKYRRSCIANLQQRLAEVRGDLNCTASNLKEQEIYENIVQHCSGHANLP